MSPSTSSIYTRTSRVRGARSVLGCLTCRRRRVKCTVQKSPCDNCQHLNLTCTPSFHANFKNWTPFVASNSHTGTPKGVRESELAVTTDLEVVESGGDEVALDIGFATEELPQDVILWLSNGLNNGSFDLGTTPTSRSFESRQMAREMPNLDTDGWNQLSPSATSYNRESYPFNGSTYNNRISAAMGTTQLTVRQHAPSTSVPTDSSISNHYDLEGLDLFASSTNLFNLDSPWEIPQIPPQMSQVYGNSHGDMPFLDQYESNMPQLLTAKTSPWNPYSYMLNSTRDCPESPLRYGILSWTCCYLSCREQNTTFSGSAYYTSASSALKDIISELAGGNTSEGFSSRTSKTSEKLYMMLSTAYFLSQCDIMLCNYRPLYDRLDSIKELFEDHWSEISGCLNTLDRRLLTWLAYLDLRSSLFGNQKYRRLGRSKRQKDLISVLIDLDGLSSLRVVSGGQSYLSACYGDNYPATELQDDLRQEPCHTKCDDVLSIFSSLNCFETWDEEHPMGSGDPMLEELRSTKVQTLRANLSRIRAVSISNYSDSGKLSLLYDRSVQYYSHPHLQERKTLWTEQLFMPSRSLLSTSLPQSSLIGSSTPVFART